MTTFKHTSANRSGGPRRSDRREAGDPGGGGEGGGFRLLQRLRKTKSGRFVGLSTFGSGPLSEPGWNRATGVFRLAGGALLTCYGSGRSAPARLNPLILVQISCGDTLGTLGWLQHARHVAHGDPIKTGEEPRMTTRSECHRCRGYREAFVRKPGIVADGRHGVCSFPEKCGLALGRYYGSRVFCQLFFSRKRK